jgi:hypothetical protein
MATLSIPSSSLYSSISYEREQQEAQLSVRKLVDFI